MKKAYIAPAAKAIAFEPLQMLAASIKVNTGADAMNADQSYSAGRGWSSDSWTDSEE